MELMRLQEAGMEKAVRKAVQILKKGGLILYPTDTLYGIGADATNPKALALLRELKGREKRKPISVIVPGVSRMPEYGLLNATALDLAARFLPGALTLVVPATERIPEELTLNGAVGLRVPADAFCTTLATAFGKPITATSANKSGRETPYTVREVLEQFGHDAHHLSLAIDDGERRGAGPSTVVSVTSDTPHILRKGVLTREMLGI